MIFNFNDRMTIEATNFNFAKLIFLHQASYLDEYVEDSFCIKTDYNDITRSSKKIIPDLRTDAYIPYKYKNDADSEYSDWKKLFLKDCFTVEIDKCIAYNDSNKEAAITPLNELKVYSQLYNKRMDIYSKMQELELEKQKLEAELSNLREWVDGKCRVIRAYETYLGTNEEIVELIKSSTASDGLPVYIHQRVFYMDEEVGIINLENIKHCNQAEDLDFNKIDVFDNWICKHFKTFCTEEKSICGFRVRRNRKDYGDAFINMGMDNLNKCCYFLIRNGESLYRVYSDVHFNKNTLFPTKKQQEEAMSSSYCVEDAEKKLLSWKYVAVALQGILDRSNVFGNKLRFKTNLLLNIFNSEEIVLVRDYESEFLIEDKHVLLWNDYLRENRKNTKVGDFIFIVHLNFNKHFYGDREFIFEHKMDYRRNFCDVPSRDNVYQVQDVKNGYYKILYYEDEHWDGTPRKKRTACWLEYDEIFNLSNTSEDELIFYLHDRRSREHYASFMPIIKVALQMLRDKKEK